MKREAVELLFNSIKNEETLVKRLALLVERTNNTILEDACAPVATNILIDLDGILSVLQDNLPGFTFKYKGPVFDKNNVEGLKFECTVPERFVKKSDRWVDILEEPYSLTQNEEFTEKRSKDWAERVIPLCDIPEEFYEVKYL